MEREQSTSSPARLAERFEQAAAIVDRFSTPETWDELRRRWTAWHASLHRMTESRREAAHLRMKVERWRKVTGSGEKARAKVIAQAEDEALCHDNHARGAERDAVDHRAWIDALFEDIERLRHDLDELVPDAGPAVSRAVRALEWARVGESATVGVRLSEEAIEAHCDTFETARARLLKHAKDADHAPPQAAGIIEGKPGPGEQGEDAANQKEQLLPGRFFQRATGKGLSTDRLRKAAARRRLEKSRQGGDGVWRHSPEEVCAKWPEWRGQITDYIQACQSTAKTASAALSTPPRRQSKSRTVGESRTNAPVRPRKSRTFAEKPDSRRLLH